MPTNYELIQIARRTRKWCEQNVHKTYHIKSTLDGMCGTASLKLWLNATAKHIPIRIAFTSYHAFNIDPVNNKVIDITATQFGYANKVAVFNLKDIDAHEYHKDYDLVDNSELESLIIEDTDDVWQIDRVSHVWSMKQKISV